MPGALQIRDVGVSIWGTDILHGIDFTLKPGEMCGLIGPSGAGKSTLMKVLLGLRKPSKGTALLAGEAPSSAGSVGYVPQDDALHKTLTVRQSLEFAAELRLSELTDEVRDERINTLCQQVELNQRMDVKVGALSGGQRKRVSVAMELLTEPDVLILDEPTSGLDPGMEATMMKLFGAVAKKGHIVLVSTHAMQSLLVCDRLLVMVAGRVAWFGTPEAALTFFGTKDFVEVFTALKRHAPPVWAKKFRQTPEFRQSRLLG